MTGLLCVALFAPLVAALVWMMRPRKQRGAVVRDNTVDKTGITCDCGHMIPGATEPDGEPIYPCRLTLQDQRRLQPFEDYMKGRGE